MFPGATEGSPDGVCLGRMVSCCWRLEWFRGEASDSGSVSREDLVNTHECGTEIPCKSSMERTGHQRYNCPTLKGGVPMMLNQMLTTAVIVAVFILYATLSLTAYRLIKQVCTRFLDMIEKLEQEDE